MIRVIFPHHLRTLAHSGAEVSVEVAEPATLGSLLEALESRYPMLRGTIRDYDTAPASRPMLRFYACEQDLSSWNRAEGRRSAATSRRRVRSRFSSWAA